MKHDIDAINAAWKLGDTFIPCPGTTVTLDLDQVSLMGSTRGALARGMRDVIHLSRFVDRLVVGVLDAYDDICGTAVMSCEQYHKGFVGIVCIPEHIRPFSEWYRL
jgi:hypothetical protein